MLSSLNRALSSPQAPYRYMGNCCSATTVPSSPEPQETETMTPAPVILQPSRETSLVPSPSQPLSRTRSRTRSMPEPTHHSRMSSQDLNPQIRMKSVPQPPQSSKSSSSSQNHRTRSKSLAALKRTNRSSFRTTSPSRAIQASIEYVVCLPPLISFICLVPSNGRSREYIDLLDKSTLTIIFL